MTGLGRKLRIVTMALVLFGVGVIPGFAWRGYYRISPPERALHPLHALLDPAGGLGHEMGFVGVGCMAAGVALYSIRKRWRLLSTAGFLGTFLQWHIFLCLLGTLLAIYHTSFRFNGIAGVGFWCMLAVTISGVVGRYLIVWIPKSLSGKELTAEELGHQSELISQRLRNMHGMSLSILDSLNKEIVDHFVEAGRTSHLAGLPKLLIQDLRSRARFRTLLRNPQFSYPASQEIRKVRKLLLMRFKIQRQIISLSWTGKLFHQWHVIHTPFTLMLLIILVAHITISVLLGYAGQFRWPF
jgi:hypothetical protein